MLGLLSAYSYLITPIKTSRFVVAASLFISFVLELFWVRYGIITQPVVGRKKKIILSKKMFFIDLFILTWVQGYFFFFKYEGNTSNEVFYLILIGVFISWFISGKLTHRFELETDKNYWRYFWPFLKSYILLVALNVFIFFLFRAESGLISGTLTGLVLYSFWSAIIVSFLYFNTRPTHTDEVTTKIFKATTLIELPHSDLKESNGNSINTGHSKSYSDFAHKLKTVYLKSFPELFEWLNKRLDLSTVQVENSVVIRSRDVYNVETLANQSSDIFINLHELNDVRRLNAYFIEVNNKLTHHSYFIGKFEPLKNRHTRFLRKYPYVIAKVFYLFDFIWRRVIPKLPVIQKFYFGVTQGKDRVLSIAECFGRLYYCGFEVKDVFEPDNFVYFIARKVKSPSTDLNPSYGPLFKMRRVGKDGKEIFVYKMRTMHPYSEYLQKFVYDINKLEEGGKLKNDFRITNWGKIFRKLWIDELPMIINWFKGELKLVGVRPLSNHYLSLYNEQLRKNRLKYKPGLVPPYYADMPKTIDEIMASEEKYLNSYRQKPLLTDFKYFFLAAYNIIIKKARSG
jgi:lipopolysaccharide/colanic/teichoic acid biosynthesis glycosyltransferase